MKCFLRSFRISLQRIASMWGRNKCFRVLRNSISFTHQGSVKCTAASLSFRDGILRDRAVATISKWNQHGFLNGKELKWKRRIASLSSWGWNGLFCGPCAAFGPGELKEILLTMPVGLWMLCLSWKLLYANFQLTGWYLLCKCWQEDLLFSGKSWWADQDTGLLDLIDLIKYISFMLWLSEILEYRFKMRGKSNTLVSLWVPNTWFNWFFTEFSKIKQSLCEFCYHRGCS